MMAWTKEYTDAWLYINKVRDAWEALQLSQKAHGRAVTPFPGLPAEGQIRLGSRTTLKGLWGVAQHAGTRKDLNVWFKQNAAVLPALKFSKFDLVYRAAHKAFVDADNVNWDRSTMPRDWEHSPAPSQMTLEQTIVMENAIAKAISDD
jgi:hypothetical protein